MSTHEYRLIATSKSPEELVQHDRVDVSLYNDPALFEAELEKIFLQRNVDPVVADQFVRAFR